MVNFYQLDRRNSVEQNGLISTSSVIDSLAPNMNIKPTKAQMKRLAVKRGDFRLLSLDLGECRSARIRDAIQQVVHEVAINRSIQTSESLDQHLAKVLTAGYRLMDPRYRAPLYQRVQLCYPIDRDEAVVQVAPLLLETEPPPPVTKEAEEADSYKVSERRHAKGNALHRAREVIRWIEHAEHIERVARPHIIQRVRAQASIVWESISEWVKEGRNRVRERSFQVSRVVDSTVSKSDVP